MENDYNNLNQEIIQKLLSQLNIKLNKQNKLIELGKKNLEKYKREIDEKLFEEDFKNLHENFELERKKENSLKKLEKGKLILESQIEKLKYGNNIKINFEDEIEDISLIKEEKEENKNSINYKAQNFLKDNINYLIDTIEKLEKQMNDNYIDARIKLTEGKIKEAKTILRDKKKFENYILELKQIVLIYQNHKNNLKK